MNQLQLTRRNCTHENVDSVAEEVEQFFGPSRVVETYHCVDCGKCLSMEEMHGEPDEDPEDDEYEGEESEDSDCP